MSVSNKVPYGNNIYPSDPNDVAAPKKRGFWSKLGGALKGFAKFALPVAGIMASLFALPGVGPFANKIFGKLFGKWGTTKLATTKPGAEATCAALSKSGSVNNLKESLQKFDLSNPVIKANVAEMSAKAQGSITKNLTDLSKAPIPAKIPTNLGTPTKT